MDSWQLWNTVLFGEWEQLGNKEKYVIRAKQTEKQCFFSIFQETFPNDVKIKQYFWKIETKEVFIELFYLNSTLNFGIPIVFVFQLEVYYKADRLLTGLTD